MNHEGQMTWEDVELHHMENYVKVDVAMQNQPPASMIHDFDQVTILFDLQIIIRSY